MTIPRIREEDLAEEVSALLKAMEAKDWLDETKAEELTNALLAAVRGDAVATEALCAIMTYVRYTSEFILVLRNALVGADEHQQFDA